MSNSTNTTECFVDAGMRFECANFFSIVIWLFILYWVIRIVYDIYTGECCKVQPRDMTNYQKEKKPWGVAETWQPGWQRRNKERSSDLPGSEIGLRL